MSHILFELASGRDGTIELRDCEFTEGWKDIFKRNNKAFGPRPPSNTSQLYSKRNRVEQRRQQLAASAEVRASEVRAVQLAADGIANIQQMGIPWTRKHPTVGMEWDDTNDIHRGFTTLSITRCLDNIELTHDEKNALMLSQPNFNGLNGGELLLQYNKSATPDWCSDFGGNLYKINSGVHAVEQCRVSRRQAEVRDLVYLGVHCNIPILDWNSKNPLDKITDASKVDFNLGDAANWAVDNDPYWNVYDLKNILGKDYLEAYHNYDDPGEWDVCNHAKTTKGGFEIRPHMHHVVNKVLVPWIAGWGYHACPEIVSPIQIGHIDEQELFAMCAASESNLWDVSHNHIVKVDLVE